MMNRFEHSPCGYMQLSLDGEILNLNETMANWLKMDKQQLLHQSIEKVLSKVSMMMFYSYFYPKISIQGHVEEMLLTLKTAEGTSDSYVLNAKKFEEETPIIDCVFMRINRRVDHEKELRNVQYALQDALKQNQIAVEALEKINQQIEEQKAKLEQMNLELSQISHVDALTGAYNRRYLNERMEEIMQEKVLLSVIMVDIDHFKKVNDTYGHLTGDVVLTKLSKCLSNTLGDKGIVTRYGGEEFALLLPLINADEALEIAQFLNREVGNQEFEVVDHITISLGVSTRTEDDTITTLFKRADDALYYVKNNGRNQAVHANQL